MNIKLYRRFLKQFIKEAITNSDGTNAGISTYLWEKQIGGFIVRSKAEKKRALDDARKAFDDHRHWPQELVLSHLGINWNELKSLSDQ